MAISSLIPDSWIVFSVNETTSVGIWLEMDMGTEQEAFFRNKVSAIVDFFYTDYEQTFGNRPLLVAVATTAGEKRCQMLLTWIERELAARYEQDRRDLLRVAALQPGKLDPRAVFLANVWYVPFKEHEGIYIPGLLLDFS